MGLLDASATMTVYDSIERGAADECEPLRGRRPRTFTLTRLLVACVAVGVCAIGATTVVNTHLVNIHEDSALANFDLGSAVDDDSAHANFDDDYPEGAQLGFWTRRTRPKDKCGSQVYLTYRSNRSKCSKEKSSIRKRYCYMRAYRQYKDGLEGCKKKLPPPPENEKPKAENEKLKAENEKPKAENEKLKAENEKLKAEYEKLKAALHKGFKLRDKLRDKLIDELRDKSAEIEKLKAENEKPKAEIKKLKGEIEKLKAGTKNCGKSSKTPKAENEKPKVKNFRHGRKNGNPCIAEKYSDAELIEALKNMTCKEVCDNDCKRFNSKRGYGSTDNVHNMYSRCLNQHYSYNFVAKIYGERVVRNNPQYSPQEQKTFGGPGCLSKCPKF